MEVEKTKDNSKTIIKLLVVIIILIIGFALIYYFWLYPPRQTANKCRTIMYETEHLLANQGKDISAFLSKAYQDCLSNPSEWKFADPTIK